MILLLPGIIFVQPTIMQTSLINSQDVQQENNVTKETYSALESGTPTLPNIETNKEDEIKLIENLLILPISGISSISLDGSALIVSAEGSFIRYRYASDFSIYKEFIVPSPIKKILLADVAGATTQDELVVLTVNRTLYVFDTSTDQIIWKIALSYDFDNIYKLKADTDDKYDILLKSTYRILLISDDGSVMYSLTFPSSIVDLAFGDIDGDGYDDIAVGYGNIVRVFKGANGEIITTISFGYNVRAIDLGYIQSTTELNIIVAYGYYVGVYTKTAATVWSSPYYLGSTAKFLKSDNLYTYTNLYEIAVATSYTLYLIDNDGTLERSWNMPSDEYIRNLFIDDLYASDNYKEIFVVTDYQIRAYRWDGSGYAPSNYRDVMLYHTSIDYDSDGYKEIIVANQGSIIKFSNYVFGSQGTITLFYQNSQAKMVVDFIDSDLIPDVVLYQYPHLYLISLGSGEIVWKKTLSSTVNKIVVDNFDNDDQKEIYVGLENGYIMQIFPDGTTRTASVGSPIYDIMLFDVTGSSDKEVILAADSGAYIYNASNMAYINSHIVSGTRYVDVQKLMDGSIRILVGGTFGFSLITEDGLLMWSYTGSTVDGFFFTYSPSTNKYVLIAFNNYVRVYNIYGSYIWESFSMSRSIKAVDHVDIDNDEKEEIVIVTENETLLYSSAGSLIWNCSVKDSFEKIDPHIESSHPYYYDELWKIVPQYFYNYYAINITYDFNYDYGDKLIILDGSGGPYTTLTGYSDWTILYKNYNTIIFWLDQDGDRYKDWGFKVNWYAMYDLQSSVICDRQNNELLVSSGGVLHYINSTEGNVISTFEYNEPILSYKLPIINAKILERYNNSQWIITPFGIISKELKIPKLKILSPDVNSGNAFATNEDHIYINWTVENLLGFKTSVYVNDTLIFSANQSYGLSFSTRYNFTTQGTYNVTIVITTIDSGLIALKCNVWIIHDKAAPTINITNPVNGQAYTSRNISLSFSLNDTLSLIRKYFIYLNDSLVNSTTNINDDSFSATLSLAAPSDGNYTIAIQAQDYAGNYNWKNITIKIDTMGPEIEFVLPTAEEIFYTTNTTINITWTYHDLSDIDKFEAYLNSTLNHTTTSNSFLLNVSEGIHNLTIVGYDTLGNNNSKTMIIYVDKTAPLLEIVDPQNLDNRSKVFTVELNISDNYGIDHTIILVNGTHVTTLYGADNITTLSITENGYYNITAITYDLAGNKNETHVIIFVDADSPIINYIRPSENVFYSASGAFRIAWNVSDLQTDVENVSIIVDGNLVYSTSNSNDTYTYTFTMEGVYNVTFMASDKVGNMVKHVYTVYYDTSPPIIEITTPSDSPYYINKTAIQVSWTAQDSLTFISKADILLNGSLIARMYSGTNLTSTILVNYSSSAIINVSVVVYDAVNNTAVDSIIIYVDLESPSITLNSPQNNTLLSINNFNVSLSLHDSLAGIYRVTISYENDTIISDVYTTSTDVNIGISIPKDGKYILKIKVFDKAGNSQIIFLNVTIDANNPQAWWTMPTTSYINVSNYIISWSVIDPTLSEIVLYINGTPQNIDVTQNNYQLNLTSQGNYNITIVFKDALNRKSSLTWLFTLDLQAPSILTTTPSEIITNVKTMNISAIIQDNFEYSYSLVYVDSALLLNTSNSKFITTVQFGFDGTYLVRIIAFDRAHNKAELIITVTIDTVISANISTNLSQMYFDSKRLIIYWNITGEQYPITVELYIENKLVNTTVGNYGTAVYQFQYDGQYTASLKIQDVAGNIAIYNYTLIIDTTPPQVWFSNPLIETNNTSLDVPSADNPMLPMTWTCIDLTPVTYTLIRNDEIILKNTTLTTYVVPLYLGRNVIKLIAIDKMGHKTTFVAFINVIASGKLISIEFEPENNSRITSGIYNITIIIELDFAGIENVKLILQNGTILIPDLLSGTALSSKRTVWMIYNVGIYENLTATLMVTTTRGVYNASYVLFVHAEEISSGGGLDMGLIFTSTGVVVAVVVAVILIVKFEIIQRIKEFIFGY